MNNPATDTIREHAANLPHSPELDARQVMPQHATKAAEPGHTRHYNEEETLDHNRDEAWRNRFEHYY